MWVVIWIRTIVCSDSDGLVAEGEAIPTWTTGDAVIVVSDFSRERSP